MFGAGTLQLMVLLRLGLQSEWMKSWNTLYTFNFGKPAGLC